MSVAAIRYSDHGVGAVYQSCFAPSADEVAEPDATKTGSEPVTVVKDGHGTGGLEAKLSARHVGIWCVPHLVAHSAPGLVDADLHASLKVGCPSH